MHRILVFCTLLLATSSARAVDGCRALLCFAYPGDPRSLPQCVATVEEVLSELARGGSFPHCALVATPAKPAAASAWNCAGSGEPASAALQPPACVGVPEP